MTEHKRIYNLKIDRVEPSQLKFKTFAKVSLPSKVDLRTNFPPVYDQGNLGSCTANALCSVYEFEEVDENVNKGFKPSRLFLYYNERLLENSVKEDAGAMLSDGIKSLQTHGICSEKDCPYVIEKFKNKPTKTAYSNALKHKAIIASNIHQDVTSMKLSLFNKNPFVVGISVYESFESDEVAKTGMVPIPDITKEQCLGGHAVVVVGWDDEKKVWILRNSWGDKWGDKGYFYLPYLYLLDSNLSSDLWNISKIN
jgi:C1A family cysteine protease